MTFAWASGMPLLSSLLLALAIDIGPVVTATGLDVAGIRIVETLPATSKRVRVASVVDIHRPELAIVWEKAIELPVVELPPGATVFTWEKWTKAPLVAGWRDSRGAALWIATDLGARGYERFPYIAQALMKMGATPRFRDQRLWAFFDSSYRLRADLPFLVARWKLAGIRGLHIAAWHYWEADAARDQWLRKLIDLCHAEGILIYAWIEFPHVSEKFWDLHPEWREKTATLADAHLDWRKLMDVAHPECFAQAAQGLRELVRRFDWDGVNLGELYFESLEGYLNPARFTPMNDRVRADYRKEAGIDPLTLFRDVKSVDAAAMRLFLDFRARSVVAMQREWLAVVEDIRKGNADLDIVLTHIDDRFDTQMRDALGADAAAVLPLLDAHDFTFLIEDPATVWHLGPQRYPEIARRYRPLTTRSDRLAIDINIVERYQDVYPTKQQTGTELFQLVHLATEAFARVALYFENSILPPDLPLLAASSGVASLTDGVVESARGVQVDFGRAAFVGGKPWPVQNDGWVTLPAGKYELAPGPEPAFRVTDFSGNLRTAGVENNKVTLDYESLARVYWRLNAKPQRVAVDGKDWTKSTLPRGKHRVVFSFSSAAGS